MRFNFKKIASVLASIAMVGSTVGLAAAANYPAPFVASGAADVAVIVGANSLGSDSVGAANIASDLATQLASQTATTGTSGVSSSGGDSQDLATSSTKLYYNSTINTARTTLYKANLPTTLADGKVIDATGTEYPYTQSIDVGTNYVVYSRGLGAYLTDPDLIINIPTTTNVNSTNGFYLYTYKVDFTKVLNLSSSNVQSKTIKVQGTDWTIGSSSDGDNLYLYASGVSTTMNEGETSTVVVEGVNHTIELVGVSDGTNAVIVVDGTRKAVVEGSTYKVGSIEVYVKDLFYLSKTGSISSGEFSVGSKKLQLTDGQSVKEGSDATAIQGTYVKTTNSSVTDISGFTVSVGGKKSSIDYLKAGDKFTDSVFGGIVVNFASATPALTDASRDSIVVDTDNSLNARVTFTTAIDNKEYTFSFAHDDDSTSTGVRALLADTANKTIHNLEGENIGLGEYTIVNYGDKGRILKLDDMSISTSSSDYITFVDALTAEQFKVTTGADGHGALSIDGQTYYVRNATGYTTKAVIVWGAGTSDIAASTPGDVTTIFPRIKLKNGEWMSIIGSLNTTVMNNGTTYSLPGVETISTYEAGQVVSFGVTTFGYINYMIQNSTANVTGYINGIDIDADGDIDCSVTATYGPTILIVEEHRLGQTNGDAVCIPLTTTGTDPKEIAIGTPAFTDDVSSPALSPLVTMSSDTFKSKGLDRYGIIVEKDTTTGSNNKVTIKYPNEEMTLNVLVTGKDTSVSTSGTSGNVVALGKVTVKDSEIDSVKAKNLIVVGGSCINTVAAKLLGSDTPLCGADFTAKAGVGAGQFLIGVYSSPYTTGKIAMLVAGFEAADTSSATNYVIDKAPATASGTMLKKTTATYADVV